MKANINTDYITSLPEISTDRLLLKPVTVELRHYVFKTLSDSKVRHHMKMPVLNESGKQERWWKKFEEWRTEGKAMQWCAFHKDSSEYVGLFTIKEIDIKNSRGELGYSIMKDLWGQGYGKEGALALVKFAFEEVDFHTLFAMILPYNIPSQKIVKGLGFEQEAHLRQIHYYQDEYYDVLQFSLINPAHPK